MPRVFSTLRLPCILSGERSFAVFKSMVFTPLHGDVTVLGFQKIIPLLLHIKSSDRILKSSESPLPSDGLFQGILYPAFRKFPYKHFHNTVFVDVIGGGQPEKSHVPLFLNQVGQFLVLPLVFPAERIFGKTDHLHVLDIKVLPPFIIFYGAADKA